MWWWWCTSVWVWCKYFTPTFYNSAFTFLINSHSIILFLIQREPIMLRNFSSTKIICPHLIFLTTLYNFYAFLLSDTVILFSYFLLLNTIRLTLKLDFYQETIYGNLLLHVILNSTSWSPWCISSKKKKQSFEEWCVTLRI